MNKKIIFILTIIISIMLSACGQASENTKANFTLSANDSKKGTLLFFLYPNGGPCKMQDKILKESIIPVFEDRINFVYASTTENSHKALFNKYGIRSVPTIIILNKDGNIYKQYPPGIREDYILEKDINFIE